MYYAPTPGYSVSLSAKICHQLIMFEGENDNIDETENITGSEGRCSEQVREM